MRQLSEEDLNAISGGYEIIPSIACINFDYPDFRGNQSEMEGYVERQLSPYRNDKFFNKITENLNILSYISLNGGGSFKLTWKKGWSEPKIESIRWKMTVVDIGTQCGELIQ